MFHSVADTRHDTFIAGIVCAAGHFKFMPQLQSLKISDCGLQGAALTAIIQALPLLPALKVLSLQGSVFDPENASLFAHQFSKLDKLKVLNMAQAGILSFIPVMVCVVY